MQDDDRPLTEAELAAPISRKNFWRRAKHFIRHTLGRPQSLPTIKPGMVQWDEWRTYFAHLGWIPAVMAMVEQHHASAIEAGAQPLENQVFTVPTEYPVQFDPDNWFAAERHPAPPAPRPVVRRAQRPPLDDLRRRYGANWGIGSEPTPETVQETRP